MDRRERRIKQQKRQKSLARGFLFFVLAIVAFFGILATPIFSMKKCTITGLSHYSYEEVLAESGLTNKSNLFYGVKPEKVEAALLHLAYIDSVKVSKKYPNTIVIDVTEKTEIAVIPVSGRYVVIDKNGVVLRTVDTPVELPFIEGVEILSAWEGKSVELVDKNKFEKAISILLLAEEKDFYFEVLDFSDTTLKAYIYYDQYLCQGSAENILANMDGIKALVSSQYKESIVHGTIIVGANGYLSFAP